MNCQPQGRRDDLEVCSSRATYQSLPSSSTPSLICHKGNSFASSTGEAAREGFPPGVSSFSSFGSSSQLKQKAFSIRWMLALKVMSCWLLPLMINGILDPGPLSWSHFSFLHPVLDGVLVGFSCGFVSAESTSALFVCFLSICGLSKLC